MSILDAAALMSVAALSKSLAASDAMVRLVSVLMTFLVTRLLAALDVLPHALVAEDEFGMAP